MCFPAGTKILTDNGHKNIENVGAGDLVLSREYNASGQKSYQRVIQTFQNITTALVEVKVENQCVKSTPGHVWWVKGKGWILADALQAGDEILTSDDALKPIHSVRHVKNFAITYNLEVENFHTYFVAAEDGQAGIWVHNNSVGVRVLRPSQVFQTLIPEIIISDRGAIRQTIGHSLAATGSYSEELRGLYAYLRRGGGAGFQGVTGDAVNRLEVVLRNIQTKGGGVVAAVDLQRIGAGRVYDLSDPAVLRRLMDSYPRFENFFTRLSGEGVVAVRGKIPAKAVQSLVNIPENLSEEARRALLQELVRPCGR
jgi:hypothetical protein